MMRVAIFAHSTNPRGGVVHAIQLAEGLCEHGVAATLLAPDVSGCGFFRPTRCATVGIPARPVSGTAALVAQRIEEIVAFLSVGHAPLFDVYHAQDPITANALAELVARGRIPRFVRTVHHLDSFADPRLAGWQDCSVQDAAKLFCVSRLFQDRLQRDYGRTATIVGNGVDTQRFSPKTDASDAVLRGQLSLDADGPVFLALGGLEARKNTLGILRAFLCLGASARLVIAGGATLLDHGDYRATVLAELLASGAADRVTLAGVIENALMPALYRAADALVMTSCMEGFGLCVLEAMACGRPAIASAIAPFTEYLQRDDCLWADPSDPHSIAAAMRAAVPALELRRRGPLVAARFGWDRVAARHLPVYEAVCQGELANA